MPKVLSPKGQALLADLPPYLADDPFVQEIVDTGARELQRVEDAAAAVQLTMFPANADDTYGFLSLWETVFGLPVNPTGVSLTERRNKVLAALQKRNVGSGSQWVATLAQAFGATPWSYAENTPGSYQVTISLPYAAGSYTAEQVVTLARSITPAHLDVLASYGTGFLIGINLIGSDVL